MVGADAYASWDDIYVDNAVRVYRLLYAKVGNRTDAEDLTTEVFLAAYGPLRVDASRGEVRAYLAATARSVLARYWRARLGAEVTHIEADVAARELDDDPPPSKAPNLAREVLAPLPERHRLVVELRMEDRGIEEIAMRLGCSRRSIERILHECRERLASFLMQP